VQEEKEEVEKDEAEKKNEIFKKHKGTKIKGYTNFNNKEDSFHDVGEFSWDFHALDLLQRFMPDFTESLQKQMNYALQMTKNTYGEKQENIDTSYLRQSIHYYL
jgi:hypothetical protein